MALAAFACALAGATVASAASFSGPSVAPVGASPRSVAAGDVNGDGKPDLVTADYTVAGVSVLLGNGDGTFRSEARFATDVFPFGVALADLDGDGRLDIVTANVGGEGVRTATVSVLLGNGDGTFRPHSELATGPNPAAVAVADLNGDGRPDLVTADRGDDEISVLLGTGSGGFATHVDYPVGTDPAGLAVGDLNGDGKLDVATANRAAGTVSVLFGAGDGGFSGGAVSLPAGQGCRSVAIADLNGDGKADLVAADSASNDVAVLLGQGQGRFADAHIVPVGRTPATVAVADLSLDGVPDVVVSAWDADQLWVLEGAGDGTFQPAQQLGTGTNPFGVALADLNGDGKTDVVVSSTGSADVRAFANATAYPPPALATGDASVTGATATLAGAVMPRALTLSYHFEWGHTAEYGSLSSPVGLAASGRREDVSAQIGGLAPGTMYHYRIAATNSLGLSAAGADATFTTPPAPVVRSAAVRPRLLRLRAVVRRGRIGLRFVLNVPARVTVKLMRPKPAKSTLSRMSVRLPKGRARIDLRRQPPGLYRVSLQAVAGRIHGRLLTLKVRVSA